MSRADESITASFSTAALSSDFIEWVYVLSVVVLSACPSRFDTVATSTPPAISSIAAVCPEVYNYTFETGARTVWHSHAGGHLILVTDGTGYYQEEGGDIQAYL